VVHFSSEEVQQFFGDTKIVHTELDTELEQTVSEEVNSRLARVYDVSLWVDTAGTPDLVRKIMAMKYAAIYYHKTYAEQAYDEMNRYALWLDRRADALIEGLVAGEIDLVDIPGAEIGANQSPVAWPDDTTGSTQQYDAAGNEIGGPYDADRKFSIGMQF
jgi:hypothetical protein